MLFRSGGGGGGGGYAGGNGGSIRPFDATAYGGYYGSSTGDVTADPSGRVPGGSDQPYYSGTAGYGGGMSGLGSNGSVVLEMNIGGAAIEYNGNWQSVLKTYVKSQGVWNPVRATFVKNNNVWSSVNGSFAPTVTSLSANWGTNPRSY